MAEDNEEKSLVFKEKCNLMVRPGKGYYNREKMGR